MDDVKYASKTPQKGVNR